MSTESDDTTALLARLADGDEAALETLFSRMRDKLLRMVRYRIDPRLAGRIDPDDVLQEAWIAAVQRIESFHTEDETAVFLWLRKITVQVLVDLHRKHLGAQMRAADQEVRIHAPVGPNSATMSALLVASLTSPSGAAMRAEQGAKLAAALDAMDPVDREIVMLRHFEELGNEEVAAVLDLTRSTASYRYIQALAKLKRALDPKS
ncbi:MAG: sigma-70 family RNA polymerase sigma factor [Planctomycetes bacterium]|nr:sigma-70 family RNA polymerase sigma factor [Planctomycetota bacterium]